MVADDGGGVRRCGGSLASIDRSWSKPSTPHNLTQLNIANPSTGQQHVVEVEDEKKL